MTTTQDQPQSPLPLDYSQQSKPINPWFFVPLLYFMQFLPYGLVTSLFAPLYRSLGVDVQKIAVWTGLAALPWTFKMFWGPLVDLNSTKRRWTLTMQACLSITLLLIAGAVATPQFFVITISALFVIGIFSATHDIACDGLYLMSLDKKRQAAFSGVMAAFSRLGRLFVDSVLVVIAGHLITKGMHAQTAWMIALGIAAFIYAGGCVWNFFALPRPDADRPVADVAPGERNMNIWRTLAILAAGVAAYYFVDGSIQLAGHYLYHSATPGSLPAKWDQTGEVANEFRKLVIGALLAVPFWFLIRTLVRGTTMGDAFVSYVKQPGFPAIFSFVVFYRFGEAMIFSMAALFIMDPPDKGGMGVSLEQLGLIKGVGQVLGLMLGGLLGGWFISRVGLRKAFWPLVVCMHVPNLLYVWAAYALPDRNWLYPVVFLEAFGYGVGFAGYFVFLMQVAQRGRFTTSHYAIGTGLGSLFITFASILAGIIHSAWGYKGVFITACILTIPGTLTLLFIPLDNEQSKTVKPAAGGH